MILKKVEKLDANTVEMEVEVGREEFQEAVEKAYRKNVSRMNVPGFRKGKAPRGLIERTYGEGVFFEDAINLSYPKAYSDAVDAADIFPVDKADFEVLDVSADGYSFKSTVTVSPEVKIGDYKSLAAYRPDPAVTDEEVEERLQTFIQRNARIQATDRPAAKGDTVNIDFTGYLEDQAFPGGSMKGHDLKIGSEQFIPGFESQLIGIMAGESRDLEITFPADYHAEELAGKPVVFKVTCNEVKETILPEVDDEFAKDISEFDTLAEFKENLRKNLLENHVHEADSVFESNMLDELIKTFEADIPEVMVDDKATEMLDNLKYDMSMRGLSMDQFYKMYQKTEEQLLEESKDSARRQVIIGLALEKVAELEGIVISDEAIVESQQSFGDRMNVPLDKAQMYYPKRMVKKDLMTTQAIDLLKGFTKVTDTPPAESVISDGE